MKHAFTVDVEDWFHGIPIDNESKRSAERRLDRGLDQLLELLDRAGVRATFFFLGPVARDYPHRVRAIAAEGHELGCHGWSHDLLYEMDRTRFVDETRRAAETISEIAGRGVEAYRAA